MPNRGRTRALAEHDVSDSSSESSSGTVISLSQTPKTEDSVRIGGSLWKIGATSKNSEDVVLICEDAFESPAAGDIQDSMKVRRAFLNDGALKKAIDVNSVDYIYLTFDLPSTTKYIWLNYLRDDTIKLDKHGPTRVVLDVLDGGGNWQYDISTSKHFIGYEDASLAALAEVRPSGFKKKQITNHYGDEKTEYTEFTFERGEARFRKPSRSGIAESPDRREDSEMIEDSDKHESSVVAEGSGTWRLFDVEEGSEPSDDSGDSDDSDESGDYDESNSSDESGLSDDSGESDGSGGSDSSGGSDDSDESDDSGESGGPRRPDFIIPLGFKLSATKVLLHYAPASQTPTPEQKSVQESEQRLDLFQDYPAALTPIQYPTEQMASVGLHDDQQETPESPQREDELLPRPIRLTLLIPHKSLVEDQTSLHSRLSRVVEPLPRARNWFEYYVHKPSQSEERNQGVDESEN